MGIGQKKQDRRDYSSITFLMGKFYGAGSDSCESLPAPSGMLCFPAASLPPDFRLYPLFRQQHHNLVASGDEFRHGLRRQRLVADERQVIELLAEQIYILCVLMLQDILHQLVVRVSAPGSGRRTCRDRSCRPCCTSSSYPAFCGFPRRG